MYPTNVGTAVHSASPVIPFNGKNNMDYLFNSFSQVLWLVSCVRVLVILA